MTRVEENNKAIEVILEQAETSDQINAILLTDISKSLAVIADALSERRAEKKNEISKAADEYFEKLINGEFGEGGPHATN
jgi:hypothetical protein